MAALIEPGTVADLSPEELFCGDANEVLSVRGNGPFHCQVTKKGRGLVYYAYPEGFAGDFAAWSLTSQQMPAWTGQLTSQAGACQWILDRALREQAHIGGAEASTTRHQR